MKNATSLTSRRSTPPADTISVGRRLDASAAKGLTRGIVRLIQAGARALTIDMSGLESADSGGFGALISALRKVEEAGARAVIVCANPAIKKMFEVASVSRLAPVVVRLGDARAIHATFASGLAS